MVEGRDEPSSGSPDGDSLTDREGGSGGARDGPTAVWERWREEGDVPFHEYCDVTPTPERARPEVDRDGWIRFTSGAARTVLRYTPLSIFVVTIAIVVATVASGGTFWPVAVLANLSLPADLAVLGAGVVWVVVLAVLLNRRDLLPVLGFVEALFVYGLLAVLLLDAAYWAAKVAVPPLAGTGGATVDGDVFPSGSLVMLYVGGLLVYDGMLRTESTFSRLHEKSPPVVGPADDTFESQGELSAAFERAAESYERDFLADLREALDHRLPAEGFEFPDAVPWSRSVRTAYVFAFWFVLPFLAAGVVVKLTVSGGVTADVAGLFAMMVLAFFEVVVFFQFLVLIKFFNRLLTEHGPGGGGDGGFALRYQPDHPDGYAGFRDLGKLATRVNVLLFLAGIYTVYRVYVAGLAVFPGPDAPAGHLLAWGFDFLGPHLVYLVTVVVWTYFSFWQLYKAMRRGRERRIEEHLDGEHDAELPDDKQYLKRAPVWPVDVRTFTGIVFGDLVPLLGLLLPLLA